MREFTLVAALCALSACAAESGADSNQANGAGEAEANAASNPVGNSVATSGKTPVPIADVPAEVVAAATAARPGFRPSEAEKEVREGRNYFDLGGTLPDGSEIEFDILEEGGRWRVVESQRDIAFTAAPDAVQAMARQHDAAMVPTRVIESDQGDGVVIYELFSEQGGNPQGRKVEVKLEGGRAEVLQQEWAH